MTARVSLTQNNMKKIVIIILGSMLILAGCESEPPMMMDMAHEHEHGDNQIFLTVREQQLAGVISDTAVMKEINETKNLVGIAVVNKSKLDYVSSRLKGRIEKLFIRSINEYVKTGSPLLTIYSEELLADQQDYISAFQNASPTGIALADAARRRLVLWGLSIQQIQILEKTKKPNATQTIFCNRSGTVTQVFVSEGQYVEIGTKLIEMTDISSVWVEAQVYPDEIQEVYSGATAEISFSELTAKTFKALPSFTNPGTEQSSKISLVRYSVENKSQEIRPGMMASVELILSSKTGLVIPRSALLMEKEPVVWVELSEGLYEKRMITIGIANKHEVEITSGLKAGEIIVTSGAYLINSEFILRNGANAMGGMIM